MLAGLTESYSIVIGSRVIARRKEMEESADSRRDPHSVRNILEARREGGSRSSFGARTSTEVGISSVLPSGTTASKGRRLSDVELNLCSSGKKVVKKTKKLMKTTIVSSNYSVVASGSVIPLASSAPVVTAASA